MLYDSALHQLHDDVIYHEDAITADTIAKFKNLRSNDDDSYFGNDSSVNESNEAQAWWVEPPASSEEDESHDAHPVDTKAHNVDDDSEADNTDNDSDDINENTDTEDGADDIVTLIQANMQLLNFLTKQRATIARLRARISRLGNVIHTTSLLD
jgi:hypothetical protein